MVTDRILTTSNSTSVTHPKHQITDDFLPSSLLTLCNHTTPYQTTSQQINPVIPCTISAYESIGLIYSDKVLCVLLDSRYSKTLIHRWVVLCNYSPLDSANDLGMFSLVGTTMTDLVAISKIGFMKFNCKMVIEDLPALIVFSKAIRYDIIFGADFLDKWGFHLNYNANQV